MSKPSNDELDAKVLDLIATKVATCARHIEAVVCSPDIGCRDIDRSLQRLRRKGVIKYISPGQVWRAIEGGANVTPLPKREET